MRSLLRCLINRSIAAKITVSFGIIIAIGGAVAGTTFISLSKIETSEAFAVHTAMVVGATKTVWIEILKQESDIRGYLLTHDASFLERAREGDRAIEDSLAAVQTLTRSNAVQKDRLRHLGQTIDIWRGQVLSSTQPAQRGASIQSTFGGEGALGRILRQIEEINAEEESALAKRSQARADAFRDAYRINLLGPCLALAVAALVGWSLHRLIANPIIKLTKTMRRLAAGDTAVGIPNTDWKEEIGAMSRALSVFRTAMNEAGQLRADQQEMQIRARDERENLLLSMADRFERIVGSIVGEVSSSALQMQTSAETLRGLADRTSVEVQTVATATKQASTTLQTVADETETLATSVSDINERMAYSTTIAKQAVLEADRTSASIAELAQSATQIGTVIDLINSVARQTNLLALNATIEAARAGDAGRGFAVVATEVKTLASQTSDATVGIRLQIDAMRNAATEVVAAIEQIGQTIGEMARVTSEINGALDTQGHVTREMKEGTRETARQTSSVSNRLDRLSEGALTTGCAATEMLSAAKILAQQSSILRDESERFVTSVRAA